MDQSREESATDAATPNDRVNVDLDEAHPGIRGQLGCRRKGRPANDPSVQASDQARARKMASVPVWPPSWNAPTGAVRRARARAEPGHVPPIAPDQGADAQPASGHQATGRLIPR
jgi:hypothetical protein